MRPSSAWPEDEAGAPVLCLAHARERVEDRVEACAEAPPPEMRRLDAQAAVPEPELLDQPIDAAVGALDRLQVLVEHRLRRAREAAPHRALEVPVEQAVALDGVREVAAAAVDVARHHGQRVAAEEDAIVVEAEAACDEVQRVVDGLLRAGAGPPGRHPSFRREGGRSVPPRSRSRSCCGAASPRLKS